MAKLLQPRKDRLIGGNTRQSYRGDYSNSRNGDLGHHEGKDIHTGQVRQWQRVTT